MAETEPGGLLKLLQIANASFPTGAFNHSFGFETWVDDGTISDAATARAACDDWLRFSVATSDAAAAVWAFRHASAGRLDALLSLDAVVTAVKPAREQRDASIKTGRATLTALKEVFGLPRSARFRELVESRRSDGNQAVVYGIAASDLGLDESAATRTFLWMAYSNLIQVIARLVPLGQTDTQRAIANAEPLIDACAAIARARDEADLSSAFALLDFASMTHERIHTRLCMS